jgi:dipeptidyl aminopeptidase/acylaminoacyl peptidase
VRVKIGPAIDARSSPINFIRNVKTPTLIMAGERDDECPKLDWFDGCLKRNGSR